jgi:hypothetical protein
MISGNEVGMSPSKQGERGCEGIGMKVTGNWSSGKGEYRRDKQILEVSQNTVPLEKSGGLTQRRLE